VRHYGRWMRDEAEKRIGHLYPKVKITKEMAKDRPDLKDYVGLGADYGETARDLAYRLYSICERKKWAEEALAYNGLVIAWPELTKLARRGRREGRERQEEMF
jgi:adenine-specific DNA methylase